VDVGSSTSRVKDGGVNGRGAHQAPSVMEEEERIKKQILEKEKGSKGTGVKKVRVK